MFRGDSVKAIMNLDFNKICRLCLRFLDDCNDLNTINFSSDLIDAVNYCYCLQIDLNDALPKKICLPCAQLMQSFYITRKNVLAIDRLLKNLLNFKNLESNQLEKETENFNFSSTSEKSKMPENILNDDSCNNVIQNIKNFLNYEHNNIGTAENGASWKTNEILLKNSNFQENNNNNNNLVEKENTNNINDQKENNFHIYSNKTNNENIIDKNENIKIKKVRRSKKYTISAKEVISLSKIYQEPIFFKNFNDKCGLYTRSLRHDRLKKLALKKKAKPLLKYNEKDEQTNNLPSSTEQQVKVIGTVIDENNILSPEVKRQRKSIFSKEVINSII